MKYPEIGMRVMCNYRNKSMRYQGVIGVVKAIGRIIRNCLIITDSGERIVVSRWNLSEIKGYQTALKFNNS